MRAVLPFAFNLALDLKTSLEIERVYAGLAALGVPERDLITQYGPCVTILVVGDRVRPALVVDVLKWKLPQMGALPVAFTEPCIIAGTPPMLSLRVKPTGALLALHDMIFTELPEDEVHLTLLSHLLAAAPEAGECPRRPGRGRQACGQAGVGLARDDGGAE